MERASGALAEVALLLVARTTDSAAVDAEWSFDWRVARMIAVRARLGDRVMVVSFDGREVSLSE